MDQWFYIIFAVVAIAGLCVFIFRGNGDAVSPSESFAPAYVVQPKPGPSASAEQQDDCDFSDEGFTDIALSVVKGDVIKAFFTTLSGTSHRNDDRTSRVAAIRKCAELDVLEIEWQPENPYDANALAVFSKDCQIGFIKAYIAAEQVRAIKRHGRQHAAFFRRPTRHPQTDKIVGAVIFLVQYVPYAAVDPT